MKGWASCGTAEMQNTRRAQKIDLEVLTVHMKEDQHVELMTDSPAEARTGGGRALVVYRASRDRAGARACPPAPLVPRGR